MLEQLEQKDEGWQDWLQKYDIFDKCMDEDQLYRRYEKFKDITFPLIPEERWHLLFKDLVSIEEGLVYGDAIGKCDVLPFSFEMHQDTVPVKSKPIMYSKNERDWINQYVDKQVELGILKEVVRGKDKEPLFLSNIVLVKEGQSQQAYRFCGNFIPLNQYMQTPSHPMVDCKSTLDKLLGFLCYSAIDIKAGFLNIVVLDDLKQYLGIITQDGIYVYERMPFGTTASACHFQAVMNYVLNQPPRIQHSTYLDDCTIGAMSPEETWSHTMEAMVRLINAGLPINIKKCQFLKPSIKLLGYVFSESSYQLGKKSICKLFGGKLPRTRQRLQSLLGQLNFASNFIPQYRQRVAPLINLLGKNSDGKWREVHTSTLNSLAESIVKRCRLGLVDTNKPIKLYVDENEGYIDAIMTQGEEDSMIICDFAHRELTPTERSIPRIERLMCATLWVIKRLSRYTYNAPKLIISFPHQAEMFVATCGTTLAPRLQAKLIELSSFQCEFTYSYSATELLSSIHSIQYPCTEDQRVEEPCWTHEDIQIPTLQNHNPQEKLDLSISYLLQFDGGCSNKVGTGGSLLWDEERKLVVAGYHFYGKERPTNNKAEAQSLYDALCMAFNQNIPNHIKYLIVQGDSALIIQFMLGYNKPGEPKLVEIINKSKALVKQQKQVQVQFTHVKRELNQWADSLCHVASRKQTGGYIYNQQVSILDNVQEASQHVFTTMHQESILQEHEICKLCKSPTTELQCWGCAKFFHKKCLQAKFLPQRRGPWYCKNCKKWFELVGTRDITLDENILNYLSHNELPESQAISARVLKTCQYISMDNRGSLWCTGFKSGPPRKIPAISQRKDIIQSSLATLNNPNGETIYQLLITHYYWTGMRADCLAVAHSLHCRQKAKAKFPPPPYLRPPHKGSHPFSIWAVDCLVNLTPPSPTGSTTVLLAVDPFTKWIELGELINLNSHETATWFHTNIICRYGVPYLVRSDRGTEFQGRFHRYLELMGVQHRYITTNNPRANGQAERMVRSIKEGITRCLADCPDAKWWEVLGDVARGLRLAISKATQHSPYHLVFKQQPSLPFVNAIETEDISQEELTTDNLEASIKAWQSQFKLVLLNQLKYDKSMIEQYKKRKDLSKADIRYIFEAGDPVLLRNKEPGKLKCRAVGPYIFIKYLPPCGMVAEIKNIKGKIYKVSSANLLPIRSDGQLRMLRYQPYPDNVTAQLPSEDRTDSITDSSLEDQQLPPGAHVIPEF